MESCTSLNNLTVIPNRTFFWKPSVEFSNPKGSNMNCNSNAVTITKAVPFISINQVKNGFTVQLELPVDYRFDRDHYAYNECSCPSNYAEGAAENARRREASGLYSFETYDSMAAFLKSKLVTA